MQLGLATLFFSGVATSIAPSQELSIGGKFPDARDEPISGWNGPVFELSQNYPRTLPQEENWPWRAFNPARQPEEYMRAVLRYALEGNVEVDFSGEKNPVRHWYHAPWLHWGRNGREFIRGLTHERVSLPGELAASQTQAFQNWAVGLYNPQGGYTIGQVWLDPDVPNETAAVFPEGTVSIKLLFTQANVDQVPYLKDAKEWDAYIYQSVLTPTNPLAQRTVQKLRLLQIDVAIKDRQADSTTGWVFGTYVYNGNLAGRSLWDRFIPVGLMWGNDPTLTVAGSRDGLTVREGWMNKSSEVPFQHLGWAGRLNGPVDNPVSSCLSCHSTAQWPPKAPLVPPRSVVYDSPEWMHWFRNIKAPTETFSEGTTSLDYSLQLMAGMVNFSEYKSLIGTQGGAKKPYVAGTVSFGAATAIAGKKEAVAVTRDGRAD